MPAAKKPRAPSKKSLPAQSFTATLERMKSNLGWTIIQIPPKVSKVWNTRSMFKVKGTINDFSFRTSLFPTGQGTHTLLVNKAMQKAAHVSAGMSAEFNLEPDTAERKIIIPLHLAKILKQDRAFNRWFETLNYSVRKWLTDWINQPKSSEARIRRTDQVAEQLMSAMDAEQELPPLIRAAFAREPRALEGWNAMSQRQRRGQLIAIFYYRNPASREKRIAKTIQEALASAERRSGNS